MNKLVAFGVAVVLCMAAAGFGAYLALRQQPGEVSASAAVEVGAPVAPAAADKTGPADTQAAGAAPTPASTAPSVERAKPQAAKPAPSRAQAADAVAGAPAPMPPALADPAVASNLSSSAPAVTDPAQPPVSEPVVPEAPPPPQKVFAELVVAGDAVIGLRVESTVSSEVARVEDPVEARVTRDVRVGSDVAIPTGARVLGSVVQVERGGKMKTAARIGVRFHTLVLPDATRLPMQTEAIYREGKSPGQESAAKVGAAAVGGAILGAIVGGGKGAAIGGAVGAAGGTGVVMAGGRNPAVLSSGTSLTIRLTQPVTVVVERDELKQK